MKQDPWITQCINLPLRSFKGDMNSSLCRLNAHIARKSLCLIFDNLIASYYIYGILVVKKEKSHMNFKCSIRSSCPISEITISRVCCLKRQEARVIKKCFSNKRVRASSVLYSALAHFYTFQPEL